MVTKIDQLTQRPHCKNQVGYNLRLIEIYIGVVK